MPHTAGHTDPQQPHMQQLFPALRRRLAETANSRIALAVFLALSSLAVVAQPFGTLGAMGPAARVVYWSIIVGVSIFAGAAFDQIALHITDGHINWRVPLYAAGMMTLAYGPFVFLVSRVFVFFGAQLSAEPLAVFLDAAVVSFTVYGVIHVLRPRFRPREDVTETPEVSEDAPEAPEPPRLIRRLARPEATIFRVSARDHMTEVASAQGFERIRLRFADAIDEMDPVPGTYVHRSHWVAISAVSGVVRRDGKLFVQLVNDEELPISRTYRPALEEARPDLF